MYYIEIQSSCAVNVSIRPKYDVDVSNKITFPSKYATSYSFQRKEVYMKLSKIYWRSPGYNRVRLLVSAIVALLFGSVFASASSILITMTVSLHHFLIKLFLLLLSNEFL